MGFTFGLIFAPWIDTYGVPQWPTPEMQARGQLRTLIGGALIATPSGAGVAMSILGGNSGSLVGVAISASLLPPAVNCGLLWAVSFVGAVSGESYLVGYRLESDLNSTLPIYTPAYSDNLVKEAALLGIVSFTLTVVNIVCIIFTGIGILKLKEVTPDKIPQSFSNFWKEDVKVHREFNQSVGKDDPPNPTLLEEAREVLGIGKDEASTALEGNFLLSVIEKAQHESDFLNIRDRVAHPPVADGVPNDVHGNILIMEDQNLPPNATINQINQEELADQAKIIIAANREFHRFLNHYKAL
ncbi:hypothetical protein TCAL_17237 [Tigriopus californicus]|uniref:Uncharacterized protein n=1 Tax=Tigriopus californicus TaxID=6832 RepID=A0A553N6S5_TIGCA|nr:hypothetical protein TCAL_17237 [Tigriopus californicus]